MACADRRSHRGGQHSRPVGAQCLSNRTVRRIHPQEERARWLGQPVWRWGMSAARLILKQPTGWFAAGREVAQALALLSDGAFKLYIHLCLEAARHTARARIELTELARVLRKTPAS